MHRSFRRRLTAGLAVVLAAAATLTACSNGGPATNADGKVVVQFWQQQFEDYQQAWFKKHVQEFNASQDEVEVKVTVVPGDAWQQKLKAAQAAGKQPDVATQNYGGIAAAATNGQIQPLDDLLPEDAFADIKDNVSDFVTIDGQHYAYPMLVEPSTLLYYRKDLATAAGLDPNSPPKTWDELVQWSRAMTQGKVKGMTIASRSEDLAWSSWGLQYNACGKLPMNEDWSQAEATDPCYAQVLDLYRELYQGKFIPQTPKVGYPDGAPYGNGEVAMMANGSWAIGQLKNDFPKLVEQTAVAPFPSVDGDTSKPTATLGGWSLVIDGKTKVAEGAAQFIDYLLAGDPEIMAEFFQLTGYSKYTVRTSVDEALADDPDATSDPFMQIVSEQVVPNGRPEPGYPLDLSLAMANAIEAAMKGSASPDDALRTAQGKMTGIIEQQGLAGQGSGG